MWCHLRRVRRTGDRLGKIEKLLLAINETTPHEGCGAAKKKDADLIDHSYLADLMAVPQVPRAFDRGLSKDAFQNQCRADGERQDLRGDDFRM